MIRATHRRQGFTLVEMVVVLLIVGILAVYAVPRFLGPDASAAITARDTLLMAARRAQQLAMNQGAGAGVNLQVDGGVPEVRIVWIDGGSRTQRFALPDGVAVGSAIVVYDGLGNAPPTTITVAGSDDVCIEATGYAHRC